MGICFLDPHHAFLQSLFDGKGRKLAGVSLKRALSPSIIRPHPTRPNNLPEAPPPNVIMHLSTHDPRDTDTRTTAGRLAYFQAKVTRRSKVRSLSPFAHTTWNEGHAQEDRNLIYHTGASMSPHHVLSPYCDSIFFIEPSLHILSTNGTTKGTRDTQDCGINRREQCHGI